MTRDALNGNLLIILIITMVVSCSASRSITTHIKARQDTQKNIADSQTNKKLDSIPVQNLNAEEKQVRKEVMKSVASSSKAANTADPKDVDKLVEAVSNSNRMVSEMFNNWIASRMENDSLRWESKYKDKKITALENKNKEEEQIGKSVLAAVTTTSKISLSVILIFGVLLLTLSVITYLKVKTKTEVDKLKEDNE